MIKCSFNALFENYLKITLVDNVAFESYLPLWSVAQLTLSKYKCQMSGKMSIKLKYLNTAFHGLLIDMLHDLKHFF